MVTGAAGVVTCTPFEWAIDVSLASRNTTTKLNVLPAPASVSRNERKPSCSVFRRTRPTVPSPRSTSRRTAASGASPDQAQATFERASPATSEHDSDSVAAVCTSVRGAVVLGCSGSRGGSGDAFGSVPGVAGSEPVGWAGSVGFEWGGSVGVGAAVVDGSVGVGAPLVGSGACGSVAAVVGSGVGLIGSPAEAGSVGSGLAVWSAAGSSTRSGLTARKLGRSESPHGMALDGLAASTSPTPAAAMLTTIFCVRFIWLLLVVGRSRREMRNGLGDCTPVATLRTS